MDRVLTEMKTSTEKSSEKDVLWNKGVPQKTLFKIHERYLWVRLLLKLQFMQLF